MLELQTIYQECNRPTATRLRKLLKAIYGIDLTNQEILESGIGAIESTPPIRTGTDRDYPDIWSIFNEILTAFKVLRKVWGDELADRFDRLINELPDSEIWAAYNELKAATSPISNRRSIDWSLPSKQSELAAKFDPAKVKKVILMAIDRQWEIDRFEHSGAEFPIASPEYWAAKETKFKAEALKRAWTEQEAIEFFGKFWQQVQSRRGDYYLEQLRRDLSGFTGSGGHHYQGFYGATEDNFRHFLDNLDGFTTKAPHRIVKLCNVYRLPIQLEGTILKHGWQKTHSFVTLGLLT